MTTRQRAFIPKDRQFWVYHISGITLLLLLYLSSIAQSSNRFFIDVYIALVWVPVFTLAVLFMRRVVAKCLANNESIENEVANVIFLSVGLAVAMTSMLALAVYPVAWQSLYSPEILEHKQITLFQSVTKHVSSNILLNFLLLSTWGFIYLGVKSKQISKSAIQKNLDLENNLKEAKLQNLSNQLKPHFLFNSLNNIRFVIHEDANRADNMITALSEILRYSLESKRTKVSLEEEMSIVMRYLDLIKLQLEDRMELSVQIDKSIGSLLVPPMVIQLLVENAIKHGVENIRGVSTLSLVAKSTEECLEVVISNPLPKTQPATAPSTKTGISNIKQRLHLLYGDDASLVTEKREDSFIATLRLPKEVNV